MTAVEDHGRLLADLTQITKNGFQQQRSSPPQLPRTPAMEGDDLEMISRKDTPWTPITGSDMILSWAVFPQEKLFSTFPASAYAEKPNLYDLGTCKVFLSANI